MNLFISNSFSSLSYNLNSGAKNATGQIINGGIIHLGNYSRSSNGTLIYQSSKGYKSRIVQALMTNAMQLLNATLTNAYPAYKRYLEKDAAKKALANSESAKKIIEGGKAVNNASLYMSLCDKSGNEKAKIYPMTKFGEVSNDAIMLSMPFGTTSDGQKIEQSVSIGTRYKREFDQRTKKYSRTVVDNETNVSSTTLVWYDLTPLISLQSSKNIVLTKVEGRDYSRKELISGGDLNFSVNGKIVSGYPDTYPEAEVRKFIEIMQYNGIVNVKSPFFSQFNVTQILIKDFNCNQTEGFKDTQPYSFTCVAVEPDEVVAVTEDTIKTINTSIEESKKSGWLKTLLSKKLDELKGSAARTAASTITSVTSNLI